jgi:hypothetical protein
MVPVRVSQCTEFALSDQRIFTLDMRLVGTVGGNSVRYPCSACDQIFRILMQVPRQFIGGGGFLL